jgi:16S rRNA (guanine966-N2)-methyltransferase
VRVIAGTLRGRALKAPAGDATRPTGARVREALFSILGDVAHLKVLDLYAGSGALGIEALSRGASSAVFVESARPALLCLRENLTKLGLTNVSTALGRRVEDVASELAKRGPFELVLCDPPWRDVEAAASALEALARAGSFAVGARIALEHSAKQPAPMANPSRLRVFDERRWGDTGVTLLEPADVPGHPEGEPRERPQTASP